MLTPRATRRYRADPPKVGEIGYLTNGRGRYGEIRYLRGRKEKYIVECYPHTCQARYHLMQLRSLATQERVTVALQYFARPEEL